MRLCALLSWFDERPDFLYNAVASLAKAGVTDIVAIDGRYRLYPSSPTVSPASNYEALIRGARKAGARLVIDQPTEPWPDEMAKRTRLFELGDTLEPDWFLIHDSDHLINQVPGDLHAKLNRTLRDVAEVQIHEPHSDGKVSMFRAPLLYRATPGIRVDGNHFTYLAPDGRTLWGTGRNVDQRLRLDSLHVHHLTHLRDATRTKAALAYYKARDSERTEVGRCEVCGKPGSTGVPTDWRLQDDGDLTASWISVCPDHEHQVRDENEQTIRALGFDPAEVTVTNRKVMA